MKKAISDIRGMDTAELRAQLHDLRKEQFGLKFRGAPEEVKNTMRFKEIRRSIARVLMVLGDRARSVKVTQESGTQKSGGGKPAGGKQS